MIKYAVQYVIRGVSYEDSYPYFDTPEEAIKYGNKQCFDDDGYNIFEIHDDGKIYLHWCSYRPDKKTLCPELEVKFLENNKVKIRRKTKKNF
jgi:hypothetical protein